MYHPKPGQDDDNKYDFDKSLQSIQYKICTVKITYKIYLYTSGLYQRGSKFILKIMYEQVILVALEEMSLTRLFTVFPTRLLTR